MAVLALLLTAGSAFAQKVAKSLEKLFEEYPPKAKN
jgi:hypothetical protein